MSFYNCKQLPTEKTYEDDTIPQIEKSFKMGDGNIVVGTISESDDSSQLHHFRKIVIIYPNGVHIRLIGENEKLLKYSASIDQTAAEEYYRAVEEKLKQMAEESLKPEKEPTNLSAPSLQEKNKR